MAFTGMQTLLFAVIGSALLYALAVSIYRLYFSRLTHIPGPKLAAITRLYEAYWDFFPKRGQFLFHCGDLHKKYGPIIRIGPDEIHINDEAFYAEMYGSATHRRNKSNLWYWMDGTGEFGDESMFMTMDHGLHRLRKSGLGSFFSKRSVQELEPRVRDKVMLLRRRFLERAHTGELLDLKDAFTGMSLDIISMYCFGRSVGALDRPDLGRKWNLLMRSGVKLQPALRAFPQIARALIYLPQWIAKLAPLYESAMEFINVANDLTQFTMSEAVLDFDKQGPVGDDTPPKTIFHTVIHSDTLPEHEKTYRRLSADAATLLAGGMDTTSRSLAVTIYHLLKDEVIRARLLRELRTIMPSSKSPVPSVAQLEQLPYLTAVIHEGTRMAHGVAGRLVRIAPDEDLLYEDRRTGRRYSIPQGATFSQSSYLIHTNETLYPKAFVFDPDRYYRPGREVTAAQRNLVAFGKGTRACIGVNLAWAELYLTVAALMGSVNMQNASHVTDRDAQIDSEYFVGCLPDQGGLQVKVLGEL